MTDKEQAQFDAMKKQVQVEHDLALAQQEEAGKLRAENTKLIAQVSELSALSMSLTEENRRLSSRITELTQQA